MGKGGGGRACEEMIIGETGATQRDSTNKKGKVKAQLSNDDMER